MILEADGSKLDTRLDKRFAELFDVGRVTGGHGRRVVPPPTVPAGSPGGVSPSATSVLVLVYVLPHLNGTVRRITTVIFTFIINEEK